MNLQRDRQLGFSSMASGTLEIMLDRRNSWAQSITLELFNGVKDIFRNHLPVETTRKQPFVLSQDAVTPVSLFEFELRELFVEATVKSADIADYLTSRGCTGTLTDHRLKYHVNDVRKDMDDFSAIPKPRWSL